MLKSKKILIGVCGSIAAYKTAELVRLFVKAGASVRVVMTQTATTFITPLTLSTLSKNPVYTEFVKNEQGEWTNHVELGLWADAFIIAPATAHIIAQAANGLCADLLSATYLSARCPVFFAPAMDLDMWLHPSVQENTTKLQFYNNQIILPKHGELASGLIGTGRMAEPEEIVSLIQDFFSKGNSFKGNKVLVTAGPTYEAIDPVRFIGNHSSGKMGYALAEELALRGAEVVLVSGPSTEKAKHPNIRVVPVVSAKEMLQACIEVFPSVRLAVMSAAVADYTPVETADQKIKKKENELHLTLTKTTDILATLGGIKKQGQMLVGFALETQNELENARNKLYSKNADVIVLNSLNDKGAGFQYDTNKVTLLDTFGNIEPLVLQSKGETAKKIVDYIAQKLQGAGSVHQQEEKIII